MITFIANKIESEALFSMDRGVAKYRAYFINTTIYAKYKAEVDNILTLDGFSNVIVTA